jgi:hypothetical protein
MTKNMFINLSKKKKSFFLWTYLFAYKWVRTKPKKTKKKEKMRLVAMRMEPR